jgi:hypothetical protein
MREQADLDCASDIGPTLEGFMTADNLFRQIVSISEAAESHREVVYHLLAAALHAAEDNGSIDEVDEVIALAEQHRHTIEQEGHNIDSEQARRRGNTPIFDSLLTTAHAKKAQISAAEIINRNLSAANDPKTVA